jgi:hypothetical protein
VVFPQTKIIRNVLANISKQNKYFIDSQITEVSLLTEVSTCAGKRRRDLCSDLILPQSMIVDESNQFVKQVLKPV